MKQITHGHLKFFLFHLDMKVGRNLARSLLEYYRFTNILPIPLLTEVPTSAKRKGRPKTHQIRRKIKNIYPTRPRTTRENAPINYTDLSIYYDSDSDDCASPARYPFHSHFMLQHKRLRYFQSQQDPFSMSTLKFENLELSPKQKRKVKATSVISEAVTSKAETYSTPPKPYVSVIDFNLLTRGGLDEAISKSPEKLCPHHHQKLKSKTSK